MRGRVVASVDITLCHKADRARDADRGDGVDSTYWKAPFYCLEEVLEVWLLNAAHIKAVPGRKTDVQDAE